MGPISRAGSAITSSSRGSAIRTFLLLTALAFVCPGRAAGDPITIDTTGPDGPGPSFVGSFGEPNAATVGQTFVAPNTGRQLDRFTFFLFYGGDEAVRTRPAGPARFAGYVSAWDGTKASGGLLYASGEKQVATPLTTIPMTFETGGVPVTPGQTYVAFLSAAGFFDGLEDNTSLRFEGETYAGGGHVALANGNDFSQVFTSSWRGRSPADVGLVAEFTPVPEPSTMLLVGIGVAAGGVTARRRRKPHV